MTPNVLEICSDPALLEAIAAEASRSNEAAYAASVIVAIAVAVAGAVITAYWRQEDGDWDLAGPALFLTIFLCTVIGLGIGGSALSTSNEVERNPAAFATETCVTTINGLIN